MSEEMETIVKIVKSNNPYPESVFTEPTNEEWLKVQEIFKDAGLIQDKFFGSQSRIVWNACCDLIVETVDECKKYDEE